MSEGTDSLTTQQVEHILTRHLRHEGYTSQEASGIVEEWFINYAGSVITEVEALLEDAEIARLVRPRLQAAADQPTVDGKTAFTNLILDISLNGFNEEHTIQELSKGTGEVGSGELINHLVTTYDVTFEFARDAVMELISQKRLELTPSWRLRLPATT